MGNLGILIGSKIVGDFGIASSSIPKRGFSTIVVSDEEERDASREDMMGEEVAIFYLNCSALVADPYKHLVIFFIYSV